MSVRYFTGPNAPTKGMKEGDRWNDPQDGKPYRFRRARGWVKFVNLFEKAKWSAAEDAILRAHFPAEGVEGCAKRLPKRLPGAVRSRAAHLGLRTGTPRGLQLGLNGPDLEEAITLRVTEGWGFERIGKKFGICEAAAQNCVTITLCRRGGSPAERDDRGYLTDAGIARLREAMRKGWKGVDIQARLGVSSSTISNERRRYAAYLKEKRKAPLPPPGGGEAYSGLKVTRAQRLEVEKLFLDGKATPGISKELGVSKTTCLRVRVKLVKRLAKKGLTLPDCDKGGVRRRYRTTYVRVPESAILEVRASLLQGMPVTRAASLASVGGSFAYKIRDALKAELEARDESLPPTLDWRLAGSAPSVRWLPKGRNNMLRLRQLMRDHGDEQGRIMMEAEVVEAHRAAALALAGIAKWMRTQVEIDRRRPLTFAEQLERVKNGARIIDKVPLRRPDPTMTLGGVASAAL